MRQTWQKAVHSLDTGILTLSRFTFGKAAFAIILVGILHNLLSLPNKIRLARQTRHNAARLKSLRAEVQAIEEKYRPEPGQFASFEQTRQKGEEIMRLYQRNTIVFSPGLIFFLTSGGSLVVLQAIGGIKKDERFEDGGVLWFRDLTQPDRYLVLPAIHLGLLLARQFILPPKFSEYETTRMPWLKRLERIRVAGKFMPVVLFSASLIFRKRPTAAENIYFITVSSLELAEDYFIQKLVTSKDETANP